MKPSSRHAHERDTQSLVSHIERGARRALGVARREWRGALATLVIVAFLWQTFASSGVAFAISETAGDVAHTVMVNADGAGDTERARSWDRDAGQRPAAVHSERAHRARRQQRRF